MLNGPYTNDSFALQTGEWQKRHNVELRDLYNRPDKVVNEIKRKRLKQAGQVWRKPGGLYDI